MVVSTADASSALCQRPGCTERVKDAGRIYCSRRCRGLASTNRPHTAMERAEARRKKVGEAAAELGPDTSQQAIAEKLGVSQQTVSRDLRELERRGEVKRMPASAVRAAALTSANERKAARAADAIGPAGRCGCAACGDPECDVRPGLCHYPGCTETAPPARQTRVARGWIRGEPTLCCRRHIMWLKRAIDAGHARGLLTGREAADWLGVADITHYLRSGGLEPDVRGPGRLMWFSEATLKRCRSRLANEGSPQLDTRAIAERWFDKRWFPTLVERYGAEEALRRRSGVLARVERRRGARARHRAGAKRKDVLREQLREILRELASQFDLSIFGLNEILAMVGEQAWAEGLDKFREYPADRWGDFDTSYRENLVRRTGYHIATDVKALLVAGK